jgi:dipeptidyl aminopeptidase/acylaminoacyl peptidase
VAALYVKLPYYGERRPASLDLAALDLPDILGALKQAVRDVRRGAAWLRARPEVDPEKVGIVGVSLGSFVAQMAAGADGGFDRCCFVLGGASVADAVFSGGKDTRKAAALLAERGWTREKVVELLAPFEPVAHAAGVKKEGVLMVNCRADDIVPPESTRRYWEALGRPEIVWYDGGHYGLKDHVLDILHRIATHFVR